MSDLPVRSSTILLEALERRLVRLIRRDQRLELEGICARQWTERQPARRVLGPGVPVIVIQSVNLYVAYQHAFILLGLALKTNRQLLTNEAAAAIGACQIPGNQLLGSFRTTQSSGHSIAVLGEAD